VLVPAASRARLGRKQIPPRLTEWSSFEPCARSRFATNRPVRSLGRSTTGAFLVYWGCARFAVRYSIRRMDGGPWRARLWERDPGGRPPLGSVFLLLQSLDCGQVKFSGRKESSWLRRGEVGWT